MATPLIPQEIYLLERYSSLVYFGQMRDAWAAMIEAAEEALRQFMLVLPPSYRARHLSLQPDIVWGERVLPNFRSTLASLNQGYIMLSHGDLSALAFGGNVQSAIKGQTSDYPTDWMPKDLEEQYWRWLDQAGERAFNMQNTEYAGWLIGSLTNRYSESARGPLDAPASWPKYIINTSVTVKTGDPVVQTGIYLPACDDSCAQILIKDYECFAADVGRDPVTTQKISETPTIWTLVERVADDGGGTPGDEDPFKAGLRLRAAAGEVCPKTGYWFTPARANSRRRFEQGATMPALGGDYGVTIWQWDEVQS